MKTRHQLAELSALLALRSSGRNAYQIAADALQLARLGKAAESNAVALCNGWRQQEAYDKKKASIERKAGEIAARYGCTAKAGGDPRGFCLRLFAAPGAPRLAGNTFGGDESGYGI